MGLEDIELTDGEKKIIAEYLIEGDLSKNGNYTWIRVPGFQKKVVDELIGKELLSYNGQESLVRLNETYNKKELMKMVKVQYKAAKKLLNDCIKRRSL